MVDVFSIFHANQKKKRGTSSGIDRTQLNRRTSDVMAGEVVKVCDRESVFHWILREFLPGQKFVRSPPFLACGRTWHLSLYPNGVRWTHSEGYLFLNLGVSNMAPPIEVRYSVGIRTAGGGTEACATGTKTFAKSLNCNHFLRYRVIETSELLRRREELLPQDVLTITFTLKLENESSETDSYHLLSFARVSPRPGFLESDDGVAPIFRVFWSGTSSVDESDVMHGEVVEVCDRESLFLWKLKQFSSLGDKVHSPRFRSCGQSWTLNLRPFGGLRSLGYVALNLQVHHLDSSVVFRYSVGIRTAGGGTELYALGTKTDCMSRWSFSALLKRSELLRRREELLPQDVLTIAFTLKLDDESSGTVIENASVQATFEDSVVCGGKGGPSEKTGVDKIVEDVGKLWPNSDHTDVVLKVRGVEFKAHRTILAARTPVLGAMFQHDTIEKASGEVSIDDCDPEVFEQLLHYIYKGAPRELTAENASALYVLADKYLVSEVKALCVCCMRDTLCLDTFCDTLTLSLMHKEDELLKTATEFLSRNMVDVLKTVEWQKFLREHPTWANEILIRATQLTAPRYKRKHEFL